MVLTSRIPILGKRAGNITKEFISATGFRKIFRVRTKPRIEGVNRRGAEGAKPKMPPYPEALAESRTGNVRQDYERAAGRSFTESMIVATMLLGTCSNVNGSME